MPTRTPGRPTTAGRTTRQPASTGRFTRQQPTTSGRRSKPATHKPATRRSTPTPWLTQRQRPAKRSKGNAALNGVLSKLPGGMLAKAAKPSAAGGGKKRAGGFALMAGAAGLALKNRDKLRRGKAEETDVVVAPVDPVATSPAAPEAPVAPVTGTNGDAKL